MARPRPVPSWPLVEKKGSRQCLRVSSSMPTPVSMTSSTTWLGFLSRPSMWVRALTCVHVVERVVKVLCNAAGALAEGARLLLLHDGLLRLADFVVGALQLGVELGLVSGQGDVFAQGLEETAFAGGKPIGFGPSDNQDA